MNRIEIATMAFVLGGALLGGGFAWLALRRLRHAALVLALGLVIASTVYVGIAAAAGAPVRWLLIEMMGLATFSGVAIVGYRYSTWWLAGGWALHALWDAPLHLGGMAATYTPAFYPELCFGFDLVAAAAASLLAIRGRTAQA